LNRERIALPLVIANQENSECTCYTEIPKLFDVGLAKELKPKYLRAHPCHNYDRVGTNNGKAGT